MLKRLTEIESLRGANPSATSFMRYTAARAGAGVAEISEWRPLDEISPLLACAVVKAEDFCFTRHRGVSWQATVFASLAALRDPRGARGVSTITQQLARNLFLTPERKMSRKFRELLLALALERALGKRRILELYLNTVEWADGVWGCAAAARHYLGKASGELDAFEAIVLSTLLPAPRRALTGANLARAFAAQKRVAWQLYLSGVLSKTEMVNCCARAARLKELLAGGDSLAQAFAAERASGECEADVDLVPFTRRNDEPLPAREAVEQEYGIERERFELIELRRRLGAKQWNEVVVSGKFFRAATEQKADALLPQESA